MATRAEVSALLDRGHTCETVDRALNISAGQAYMIATGTAADGADAPTPERLVCKPVLPESSQQLVNPPLFSPRREQQVLDWVRTCAARELTAGSRA